MQFEPALLSYAGLACLALTSHRLRRDVALSHLPAAAALRMLAAILLSLAAWRAIHHFGPEQGWVAFLAMVSIAGLPLVLLLSRWPRAGLLTGVGALVVGLGAMLSGLAG